MRIAVFAFLLAWSSSAQSFSFRTNDVIAFLGGTDVVTAQHSGHLEALLAIHYRSYNLRFRNFGWEGDTVFAQPRDFGFPPLEKHIERVGATVIVFQFGRAEALNGHPPSEFAAAYSNLLSRFTKPTTRFLLVIPPRFEQGGGLLPDLTKHNPLLAKYAPVVRAMGFPVIDLSGVSGFTDNGMQITEAGHAGMAAEFARQLGITVPNLSSERFKRVRYTVVAKNRLWFDYWRPQNWAFLGGDRISVPSSRDHRDPKIRWFPSEIEKFLPLIAAKEKQILQLAASAAP